MSSEPKISPQNRKPPTSRNPPPDIPDAITDLIGKIRTDGFVDGVDQLLRDNLENSDLCSSISLLRIENYNLKEATVNNDPAIIKAKMLFLERENIRIRAQLEEEHAIVETQVRENIIRVERLIGELVPTISCEIRGNLVDEVNENSK
ncbi:hypothetical protein AVEN_181379-1 [Araneus ventricosus]|uniref:Uncharacterized protein n=1 Tax=Araneus ventricosus TaxID=182803 RepID=A0A4Y2UBE2_ARAVE|nr:hypothetical protein AVEN_181379-1 [Araneus ventricosus]